MNLSSPLSHFAYSMENTEISPNIPCLTGQEKTQVRLPGASKFCSWASENGSLVARWASETNLSSLVSDNSSQKQLKNLRLQDEKKKNNELKVLI